MDPARIHLVTFATRRFRLRQQLLGLSARWNDVVDNVCEWSPERLQREGFASRAPAIDLGERGAGFWAWKPFIIEKMLQCVPDGDIVFYCDVGRMYPIKLLDTPITHFLDWMDERDYPVMPGLEIPWSGPMSVWTKRDAFVALDQDTEESHSASPIQASFSVWRGGREAREIAKEWMDCCAQRELVSDDLSQSGVAELEGFRGHRHDQSLLTLCCLRRGISGITVPSPLDGATSRHPSEIVRILKGDSGYHTRSAAGKLLAQSSLMVACVERSIRRVITFGEKQKDGIPAA